MYAREVDISPDFPATLRSPAPNIPDPVDRLQHAFEVFFRKADASFLCAEVDQVHMPQRLRMNEPVSRGKSVCTAGFCSFVVLFELNLNETTHSPQSVSALSPEEFYLFLEKSGLEDAPFELTEQLFR